MDDLHAMRGLYSYLRRHPSVIVRGQAYMAWQSANGPRAATFLVASDGTVWRNGRASLIANLRTIALRAGLPVAFVARWDRDDN